MRIAPVGERVGQREQAEAELRPENHEDRQIGPPARETDARIEDAPVQQHAQTGEADQAGRPARDDGQQLLVLRADERLVEEMRRQQAHRVPEQQEQDADVKQVAAPAQLARAQKLR